ncbi:hypothetical protein IMCC3317_20490 [Kordia antarctica]|uniref:Biopolymer transport protein ExbD n=1 Tax=Kordia antarctica TaxID=1218801 RepID=A0A7L4ZL77_9FLAO|nr:biopolymer transporter ExbD [Kordia antarctica]QHI36684.1 hypothetical protein IMCC3317_20490 [Kordia antarctica]
MGLLETNNRKFNLPLVFIIGVIFLIALAYFANYLENIPKNALDLELPKAVDAESDEKSVTIYIAENLEIHIDSIQVIEADVEEELKILFEGNESPTIILKVAEGVPIEKAVNILDIANNNRYKIILNVQTQ